MQIRKSASQGHRHQREETDVVAAVAGCGVRGEADAARCPRRLISSRAAAATRAAVAQTNIAIFSPEPTTAACFVFAEAATAA